MYSLKNKILFYFVTILIIPFTCLVFFSSQINNSNIGEDTKKLAIQSQEQYADYLNIVINHIENVNQQLIGSNITQQWILSNYDENISYSQQYKSNSDLKNYISSISVNDTIIDSIDVINKNGNYVNNGISSTGKMDYTNLKFYTDYKNFNKSWSDSYINKLDSEKEINSKISDLTHLNSFRNSGIIIINFETSTIQKPLNNLNFGKSTTSTILDNYGNSIFLDNKIKNDKLYKEIFTEIEKNKIPKGEFTFKNDNEDLLVFYNKLSNKQWVVVSTVNKSEFYSKLESTNKSLYAVSGILFLLAALATITISRSVTKPLTEMFIAMKMTEKGEFVKSIDYANSINVNKNSEIGGLIYAFTHMTKKIKNLIEIEYRINLQKKDLEYKALVMQINPHFLSNTLEVISSLLFQKRYHDAINVNESLGEMLKNSMSNKNDLITLEKEIQNIQSYINIMKIRFKEKLIINMDIDKRLYKEEIIKFLIQPLLENSIKYSNYKQENTIINIVIKKEFENISIKISDNGCGMDESLIENILKSTEIEDYIELLLNDGNKIGLKNVIARLKIFYNEDVEIKIDSKVDKGTSIEIILKIGEKNV